MISYHVCHRIIAASVTPMLGRGAAGELERSAPVVSIAVPIGDEMCFSKRFSNQGGVVIISRIRKSVRRIVLPGAVVALCCLAIAEPGGTKKSNLRAIPPEVKQASQSFKDRHDVYSLLLLFQHLKPGLSRSEVEELLGQADYSPINGQYYFYAKDAVCSHDVDGPDASCGVVVEYRRYPDETVRNTLQSCTFGFIGE